MTIRTAMRAVATTAALITIGAGLTACSGGAGANAYVWNRSAFYMLSVDGKDISTVRMWPGGDGRDKCADLNLMINDVTSGKIDPNANAGLAYEIQNAGTINQKQDTVIWTSGNTDAIQFDVPDKDMVTVNDKIYVKAGSAQGKALIDEARSQC